MYDMGQYCLASMFGRETFVSLPSGGHGGMYDIYNGGNVIPHIEWDEGTDTRVFGPKSIFRITSLWLYSGTGNKTRSRFTKGSIPKDLTPMWEKVGNCG
jgi:hypothetical protein